MTDLYPRPEANNIGKLQLDDTHNMTFYEYGNPDGVPILYLHGGPGGGSSPEHARYFDPDHFRIICFDQRGCGKSTPHASTDNNTPDHLVSDIEKLRKKLEIDTWHVSGGSWGTTLSLLYAQEHPEHVNSLLLRGIFMMREQELTSLYIDSKNYRPQAYKEFIEYLPEDQRHDPLTYYHRLLMDDDPAVHVPAAKKWCSFETRLSFLDTQKNYNNTFTDESALACARLEADYFVNHLFDPRDRVLKNVHKMSSIPMTIVQGAYDLVCPQVSAYDLHRAVASSHLEITVAGHAGSDPETAAKMVEAADRIKDYGSPLPRNNPNEASHNPTAP
jgi:proline iminopeptidase